MTFLVLAHPNDGVAVAVAAALARRHGPERVRVRTPDEIVLAPLWEHCVSDDGAGTRLRMHDGGGLGRPAVVLNRLPFIEPHLLHGAAPADREYAWTEMLALLLSALSSLDCPVVNRPSSTGLAGATRRPLSWQRLAAQAGLRTAGLDFTSSIRRFAPAPSYVPALQMSAASVDFERSFSVDRFGWYCEAAAGSRIPVDVVGGRGYGDAPASVLDRCARLAASADVDLLRVELIRPLATADALAFAWADAFPQQLIPAGMAALVAHLEKLAASAAAEAAA